MESFSHSRDGRIPSLDGMRAVAILMVVLSHLSGAPGFIQMPPIADAVFGDTGVRIFFVLSGFLITTLLLAEHAKKGEISLSRFYVRRCFRIFPAFYFYLAVLAGLSFLGWILILPGDLPKAAFYVIDYYSWNSTSNFVRHIWSLSVEEQFYLIWPVAIWALGIWRAQWIAVASVVLSPFWRLFVSYHLPGVALTLDRRFDCISDALASGCLLACLNAALSGSTRYRAALSSRWMHLLPALVLALAATSDHPHFYYGFADTAINLGIAFYLHRAMLYPPRWLNTLVLRQVGLMSYSIYLWQQLFCSEQEGMERWPWFLGLPATLGVSALSYYVLEGPLQRLGRRLTKTNSPREITEQARIEKGIPQL